MLNRINDAAKEDVGAIIDNKALTTGGSLDGRGERGLHSTLAFMGDGARHWISSGANLCLSGKTIFKRRNRNPIKL